MVQQEGITSQTYVVFQVGENEFALPLFQVRRIVSPGDLNRLAGDEEGKAGTVLYRGRTIDVIDLGKKLAVAKRSYRQPSIIVLNEPAGSRGVLVDSDPIPTFIEARQIRPLPAIARSPGDPYEGVARLGEDRLVILLAAERL